MSGDPNNGNATGQAGVSPPRITRDPSNDAPPDYSDATWAPIAEAYAEKHTISQADAVNALLSIWQKGHEAALKKWQDQVERDAEEARIQQEDVERTEKEATDALQAEAEKLKAKDITYDENAVLTTSVDHWPSAVIITKMRTYQYHAYWNHTVPGCQSARETTRTESGTSLDIQTDHLSGQLSAIPSTRESPNSIPDEQLTWDDVLDGKTVFLKVAKIVGWKPVLLQNWAQFFMNLDNHDMRRVKPHGKTILVRYFAHARYQWHLRILHGEPAYNLSVIDESTMERLEKEYFREEEVKALVRVSHFTSRTPGTSLTAFILIPSLLSPIVSISPCYLFTRTHITP